MCLHQVVDPSKGITDVPEWFKGSRLNYAENLLKHEENDKIALYAARKSPVRIFVTAGSTTIQISLSLFLSFSSSSSLSS